MSEFLTLVLTTITVCLVQTAFNYVKDKIIKNKKKKVRNK